MTPRSDSALPRIRTALYPGSFNPYTRGHHSIVERTLSLCDRVVIAIGHNIDKPIDGEQERLQHIRDVWQDDPRVSVEIYSGLTVDFARRCGADFMVRGVRNSADFEYERNLAEVNLRIGGIETILIPALPELAFISSSMVRELEAFGHDVSEFIV